MMSGFLVGGGLVFHWFAFLNQQILCWSHLAMPKQWETTTAADLESLWRFTSAKRYICRVALIFCNFIVKLICILYTSISCVMHLCKHVSCPVPHTAAAVNWEIFCVKIFLLVQPTMKIKLPKIFNSVNSWYDTKAAVLNALLLTWFTASPHLRCQFEATSSSRAVFRIPKNHCQHVCQRKWSLLQTRRWRRLS